MNIRKLQYGGVAPFMSYTPAPQQTPTAAATATPEVAAAATATEGLLDDDMIKQLYKEGLTSDVTAFLGQVSQLEQLAAAGAIDKSALLYKRILPQMNRIAQNSAQMKDVTSELNKNGGMYEAAIVNGGVMVQDADGNIKPVSVADYSANQSNYRIITNNELKNIRESTPYGAFDDNYMMALRNGKGMKGVTEELTNVLAKAKNQSIKDERYLTNAEKLAVGLFEKFSTASEAEKNELINDMDGTNVSMTEQQKSNAEQVNQMMSYMLDTIDSSSKTLIQLKAIQSGTTPEAMLAKLMFGMTESETSRSLSASKAPVTKDSSVSGSGDITGTTTLTDQQIYASNVHGLQPINFNPGNNYTVQLPGMKIYTPKDTSGKPLDPNTSISNVINKSLPDIADVGNVWIGNKRLSSDEQAKVVTTGENNTKIYMPLDLSELAKGYYKPDLEAAKRISQAEDYIAKNNVEEGGKADIYRDFDVEDYYVSGNNIVASRVYAPFMAYEAAYQRGTGINDGNKTEGFVRRFDPANEDVYKKAIVESITGSKTAKDKYTHGGIEWLDSRWYKGTVFVHTSDDNVRASGDNLNIAKSQVTADAIRRQAVDNERQVRINNTQAGTNALGEGA